MANHRAIPPLLQPYFELGDRPATTVLTSTLGASTNWLVERYIVAALSLDSSHKSLNEDGMREGWGVVLVSWMRDLSSWKAEVRRASGIDLSKAAAEGRFIMIDALNGSLESKRHTTALTAAREAVEEMTNSRKALIILDQPDVAVASSAPGVQFPALLSAMMAVLRVADSAVVAIGADSPLMAPATAALHSEDGTTPHTYTALESQHAALATTLMHQARHVMQMRKLETGWANDVSGVVRICRGGSWEDEEGDAEAIDGSGDQEKELLYHVRGDGSVKVFERGAYASG